MEPEGSLSHSQRARHLSEQRCMLFISFFFLFRAFLCVPVIDIICNISQRSNDGLSLLSLSSVLSSAVAMLSASRIIKHALFQRERHWTLAMSRLKEPQEKVAVT